MFWCWGCNGAGAKALPVLSKDAVIKSIFSAGALDAVFYDPSKLTRRSDGVQLYEWPQSQPVWLQVTGETIRDPSGRNPVVLSGTCDIFSPAMYVLFVK
jgi:hypothetical protein